MEDRLLALGGAEEAAGAAVVDAALAEKDQPVLELETLIPVVSELVPMPRP